MNDLNTQTPWLSEAVLSIASGLVSERGENPEYDRALTEMVCGVLGLSTDDYREQVEAEIRDRSPYADTQTEPREDTTS